MSESRKARVLIVDDNPAVRSLVREIVSPFAADVHECDDGCRALTSYQTHRPDVVLMDISMPILDGLAATRQIRQFDDGARIVIVTNHDLQELRDAARAAGASGYVVKTDLIDLTEFVTTAVDAGSRGH